MNLRQPGAGLNRVAEYGRCLSGGDARGDHISREPSDTPGGRHARTFQPQEGDMLEQQESVEPTASPEEAEAIATLAYGYGFPLVLMDVSREVMTAVPSVEAQKGPINQFIHVAEFPDDTYRDVVSPNVDTLYSLAWLDLAAEPIVLPRAGPRRPLLPDADLRRLDERVRGAGHAHDRESRRGLRPGRTRLARHVAGGRAEDRRTDQPRLDHRTHVHRRQGRLRRGQRDSTPVRAGPARRPGGAPTRRRPESRSRPASMPRRPPSFRWAR